MVELERRLAEHDAGQTADVPWEIVNRMLVNHEAVKRGRIYSAPRRFDLATIFAVTTAYSALFATLSAIQIPPQAIAIVGGFITCVGIGQALLFRGQKPRWASVLVGMAFAMIYVIGMWLMSPMMPTPIHLGMLMYAHFVGALSGYVAGVLVGGVFLVADIIRRRYGRTSDDDVPFPNASASPPLAPPQSLDISTLPRP